MEVFSWGGCGGVSSLRGGFNRMGLREALDFLLFLPLSLSGSVLVAGGVGVTLLFVWFGLQMWNFRHPSIFERRDLEALCHPPQRCPLRADVSASACSLMELGLGIQTLR